MPKVWRRGDPGIPAEAIYVGRPTKWGNPFIIGMHGTRREVIEHYEKWLYTSGMINEIGGLRGFDLVCWCAPSDCHADVLLRLANT